VEHFQHLGSVKVAAENECRNRLERESRKINPRKKFGGRRLDSTI
jgi:hypothetical protein